MSVDVLNPAQEYTTASGVEANAMAFLQTVFGPDQRLTELTQNDAAALSTQVVEEYTHCHANTSGEKVKQSDYERLHAIVAPYVAGIDVETIAQVVPGLKDGADVVDTLNDIVTTLWCSDEAVRNASPDNSGYLEQLLVRHTGEWRGAIPLHALPIGRTATGVVETSHEDPAEKDAAIEARRARLAKEALQAVKDYAATPEFKRAAGRKDHKKSGEIFMIMPEDTDEDSAVLRHMAWLVSAVIFAKKDLNSLEDLQAHANKAQDYFCLSVDQSKGDPIPMGAMCLKVQPKDPIAREGCQLPSVEDIFNVYDASIRNTTLNYRDPDDPSFRLPDLRYYPNVMDVMTVAVMPGYELSGANPAMFNAVCLLADALGIECFAAMYDKYAAQMLNSIGLSKEQKEALGDTDETGVGFEPYAPESVIPFKTYLAGREGDNHTRPYFCWIAKWKRQLLKLDPSGKVLNRLFGRKNVSHARYKMPNVWRERLPIPASGDDALAPEKLFDLAEEFTDGDPVLVIDRSRIGESMAEFKAALPGADLHYAMKCNPDRNILSYIKRHGGSFEVASYAELEELLVLGADIREVLYSNPVKNPVDIAHAYRAGVRRFAVQGKEDLDMLAQFAPGAQVYLRLETTNHGSTVQSEGKFGFRAHTSTEQHAAALLMKYAASRGLKPYGLAFHVGSQMESPDAWVTAIQQCGELMTLLKDRYGITLDMLDIGGGFPAYHQENLPTIADFGKTIMAALRKLPYRPKKIAYEAGRAVVSNAGALITTVQATARRNGQDWLYLNVGAFNGLMEALETNTELSFPMADGRQSKMLRRYIVSGPSCDSQDTVSRRQLLSENLRTGDRVIVYTTGAYTTAYTDTRPAGVVPARERTRRRGFNGFAIPQMYHVPLSEDRDIVWYY
jgi:ornithine decarboxylase